MKPNRLPIQLFPLGPIGSLGLGILLTVAVEGNAQQRRFSQLTRYELIERFDKNGDGRLDDGERKAARASIRETREESRGGRSLLRHGDAFLPAQSDEAVLRPDGVAHFPKADWFAPNVLRTVFLDFVGEDWHGELTDFYRTDVEVPATMHVDGVRYEGVGVRYRGSSSYLMVHGDRKKSLNISVDRSDAKLRVRGNRTINLLNCNQDTSLIRDAVFAHVAGHFVPTLRVNFVRVVINGVSWGVYANAEQFNRDFLEVAFGSRKGTRWKIERNYGGVGALRYLGDDPKAYAGVFELKSSRDPESDTRAWERLIAFCKKLNRTSVRKREAQFPSLLDVDRALWFLALEWVFQDGDGYVKQGYDYRLVEDRHGRFMPVPYDNNEILPARGGRFRVSRSGQRAFGTDPLEQIDNVERPLISRLLSVGAFRARYLAHVRTIATRWLDWKNIGPVCRQFHDLIAADVAKDRRSLTTARRFTASFGELEQLVTARREAILADPAIAAEWPAISDVRCEQYPDPEESRKRRLRVTMTANMERGEIASAWLYYRTSARVPYSRVGMERGADGAFVAETDGISVGGKVRYYVEARASIEIGTTAFAPEEAEAQPSRHKIKR